MAWTSPMTAVANSVFTAAQFNTNVRDNLNETAPAKATTAGRLLITTGVNSIAERAVNIDAIATSETTSSATFADLATVGPTVEMTVSSSALVFISCDLSNDNAGALSYASCAVSGASSVNAMDIRAVINESTNADDRIRATSVAKFTGLNPGSHTFTMQYRVSAGTGTFQNRELNVIGF